MQFGLGAVLEYSTTPARNASRSDAGGPSLRTAGSEDEDEYEAPCEAWQLGNPVALKLIFADRNTIAAAETGNGQSPRAAYKYSRCENCLYIAADTWTSQPNDYARAKASVARA
jgi:hypothetical protein